MSEPPVLLIVDDEEGILRAMRRSLRREGYTILTVQHADDVREALEAHPVDVVLSDYKMGAISGLDVLALAAEIRPGLWKKRGTRSASSCKVQEWPT